MRLSRAKQMRKHLRFYRIVYGIAPPYAVSRPIVWVWTQSGMMSRHNFDTHVPTLLRSTALKQVLLDGNFIHMALKVKMDILDRLKKLLLGEDFKCFVPRYD